MHARIQEAREKEFGIQTALPELAKAFKGLITWQNEIYKAICLWVEKILRVQFKKHSNIIIPFQVFMANVQTAFTVMKVQSMEEYEGLWKGLSEQIVHPVKSGMCSSICLIKGNNSSNI